MKTCAYCGRENRNDAVHCHECGTTEFCPTGTPADEVLGVTDEVAPSIAVASAPVDEAPSVTAEQPRLRAKQAFIVLFVFLGGQIGMGFLLGLVAFLSVRSDHTGLRTSGGLEEMPQTLMAAGLLLSLAGGGAAMYATSRRLIGEQITDNSPTGASWVLGPRNAINRGLVVGLVTGFGYLLVGGLFAPPADQTSMGPLARMAITPGFEQALWVVMALAVAPPFEELLFRGVFYGGCRASFGRVWAAILTTFIFVLLHASEVVYFLPAIIGITGLALAALRMRLRWGAIGPAIAVHFGYNLVMALAATFAILLAQ